MRRNQAGAGCESETPRRGWIELEQFKLNRSRLGEWIMVDVKSNGNTLTGLEYRDMVNNILGSRQEILRKLLDPRRDISAECGFPQTIRLDEYRIMYEREPVPCRVVDLLPQECWQV